MRTKRSAMFTFVALFAVCGLLLGASAAGAATNDQGKAPSKEFKGAKKQGSPAAGPVKEGAQSFFRSLAAAEGVGYCESSCCWASGCDSVSCSETSCSATCGKSFAIYFCNGNSN